MDEYISTKTIVALLKVHVITVRRWISEGKLPAIYLGKEYRIKKRDFEKFLEDRRVKR